MAVVEVLPSKAVQPRVERLNSEVNTSLETVRARWRQFYVRHQERFDHLEKLSTKDVVELANRAMLFTAKPEDENSKLPKVDSFRKVDESLVQEFLGFSRPSGAVYVAMRHGAEALNDKLKSDLGDSPSPAEKKRQMMQLPNNEIDPAELQSLIEAVGVGIVLRYIQQTTGKKLVLRTSEFYRAKQPALVMEAVLHPDAEQARVITDKRLNSLSYISQGDTFGSDLNVDLPGGRKVIKGQKVEEADLEAILPEGTIALEKLLIDAVGKLQPPAGSLDCDRLAQDSSSVYDVLQARAQSAREDLLHIPTGDTMYVDITHTQQHAFGAQEAGYPDAKKLRLAELGFLAFRKQGKNLQLSMSRSDTTKPFDGILTAKPVVVTDVDMQEMTRSEDRLSAARLIVDAGNAATHSLRFSPRSYTGFSPTGVASEGTGVQGTNANVFPPAALHLPKGFAIARIGHNFNRMGIFEKGRLLDSPEELALRWDEIGLPTDPLAILYVMQENGATFPSSLLERAQRVSIDILLRQPLPEEESGFTYSVVEEVNRRGKKTGKSKIVQTQAK